MDVIVKMNEGEIGFFIVA